MISGNLTRATVIACLMISTALPASTAAAQEAAQGGTRSFDIAAQSLPAALNLFARQAGVQIFYPSATIATRRSAPLKGSMTRQAALRHLLAGTALELASDDGRVVLLRVAGDRTPAPAEPAASSTPDQGDILVTGVRASLGSAERIKRQAG